MKDVHLVGFAHTVFPPRNLHASNYSKISSPFKPHSVLNPPHLPTTLTVFINDDASGAL